MSGALDLSSYQHIQQTSFVKIDVPGYGTIRMSNFDRPFDVYENTTGTTNTYTPMGSILAISEFNNELRPSNTDITLSLAAIDQAFIPAMMSYSIKGSKIEIRRAFFDALTGELLSISDNPSLRFTGVVANYNFSDTINDFTQSNTTTINISCSSIVKVLQGKVAGQTTNDSIRKNLYGGDLISGVGSGTGFQFEVLTTDNSGGILTFTNMMGGTGYANGTFTNVVLSKITGSGSGAKATVVVAGGTVTSLTITTPGTGYKGQDRSFDRVATIATSNFNFGAPV